MLTRPTPTTDTIDASYAQGRPTPLAVTSIELENQLPPIDVKRVAWQGLLVLFLGFGGFLAWAALAPLAEGVPASATVVVESRPTQIQHHTMGIVADVRVKEGAQVRAGDVLVSLVNIESQSQLDEVRMQWATLAAREARLFAEQLNEPTIRWPEALLRMRGDIRVDEQIRNQEVLRSTRKAAYQAEVESLRRQISQSEAGEQSAQSALTARQAQARTLEQDLRALRELVSAGFASRVQQNDLERRLAETNANIAEQTGLVARFKETKAETEARLRQREATQRTDIESQLSETRRDTAAQSMRLRAAEDVRLRTDIRAPIAGAIVGIGGLNAGSAVTPGAKLLEIVPIDARLILEAKVPIGLVDRLAIGQDADIQFLSFVNEPLFVLPGRLVTVSASSVNDPATGVPYFNVRVELLPTAQKILGQRTLQPGMPAQVLVKTGERSLLAYLARPLMRRFNESLKEP